MPFPALFVRLLRPLCVAAALPFRWLERSLVPRWRGQPRRAQGRLRLKLIPGFAAARPTATRSGRHPCGVARAPCRAAPCRSVPCSAA
eukprot:1546244-Lingulodinium_polyedra.AAC.1